MPHAAIVGRPHRAHHELRLGARHQLLQHDFGRIAAANAISDVYAMGGVPITALNLVGFPAAVLDAEVLVQILEGGARIAREAGIEIVGGHTIQTDEPIYGLAVTGTVHPDRVVTNAGAQLESGDVVVLALPGAELPGGSKAKVSKASVRGVASDGMLCSGADLCWSSSSSPRITVCSNPSTARRTAAESSDSGRMSSAARPRSAQPARAAGVRVRAQERAPGVAGVGGRAGGGAGRGGGQGGGG